MATKKYTIEDEATIETKPVEVPKKVLSDTFTIKIGNQSREIFMSYALLNMLASYVGDIEQLLRVGISPNIHADLTSILLAPRDKKGRPMLSVPAEDGKGDPEPFDLFSLDLTPAEVERLIDWAGDHLMDFFMRGMQAVMTKTVAQAPHMQKIRQSTKDLEQSIPGIEDLLSNKSAAGL